MSVKGIRFNGETIDIPQEYLHSVDINGNTITFTNADGSTVSYTPETGSVDLSEYAKIEQLPTATSQLTNDSGFITSDDIPETPTNLVTTDTEQTITGTKRFESIRFTNDDKSIVIGTDAGIGKDGVVSIGAGYVGGRFNVIIGSAGRSSADGNVFIGAGGNIRGGRYAVCIAPGSDVSVGENSVSIGSNAQASANNSIQLGAGTNQQASTFQVFSHQLLDANGKIPNERLNITTDGLASETYVNTQISNLIDSAPDTLNTLNKLAVAIQENDALIDTLNSAIGTKANQTALDATNQTVSGLSTSVSNLENNKADKTELFSGSYNDLTDKPDLFSGSYNDLSDKPTIPTATSQLTNDSGFITAEDVPATDLSGYVTNETFSEFQQDVQDMSLGLTTMVSDVRTELVNKDTELQGQIDAKANTADLSTVATSGSYNDLSDKPTIPTKTSDLTNDSGFVEYGEDLGSATASGGLETSCICLNDEGDDYWEAIYNPYWWMSMNSYRFGIHTYNSEINEPCLQIDYTTGDASFYNQVNASIFNASSDLRLKENIKDYKCKKSILDLPIKEFDYKKTGTHSIGCIAQDLQEICPEIVNTDKDGYLSIQEGKLVYLLLQEVKQLKAEIDKLKEI